MILYKNFYSASLIIKECTRTREWMTNNPHSYRCTPLAIANEYGWDVITPYDIIVNWNGGKEKEDLIVEKPINSYVNSHFGSGTITINPGIDIKTELGIYTMIIPVPNEFNNHFSTLSAIIETDKLDYPWFLTLKFLNTGKSVIKAGTRLARILPININASKSDLNYRDISTNPERISNEKLFAETRRKSFENNNRWTKQYINMVEYSKIKMKINDTAN